jgi:hypothetical protein
VTRNTPCDKSSVVWRAKGQEVWTQDSSVGMGWGLDGPKGESRRGQEVFSSPKTSRPALITRRPVCNGNVGSFPEVKRTRREADISSNSKVGSEWNYTPVSPVCLYGVDMGALSLMANNCVLNYVDVLYARFSTDVSSVFRSLSRVSGSCDGLGM